MKKINSIEYGNKILVAVIIPLIIVPMCLLCVHDFIDLSVLILISRVSFIIGSTLAILFFIFLSIEWNQDKKRNKYYANNMKTKLPISNNRYECQFCGNTKLKASDTICNICGTKFKVNEGNRIMENETTLKKATVEETLYIPLFAKAKESRLKHPIIYDSKALEIAGQLEYNMDDKRFDGGEIAHLGIISRTEILDAEIRRHLEGKTNLTVINLGVGLDTRAERLNDERITWFDLDMPEVIKLRKKFFKENERTQFIAKSVFDSSWTKDIQTSENIVIIAEGLLMYFTEEEIKQIFQMIAENFQGAHMYFDVVHSFFVGKGISSKFRWGIDRANDIEKYNPHITLIHSWSTGDLHKERQSLFFRIMNVLPSTRNRSQILNIQFK